MEITPLEDGTYDVSLCYYVYMRQQPSIEKICERYPFELMGTGRLDDYIDTSTPDAPVNIYSWDMYPDYDMGDSGLIDLFVSQWPTHLLVDCEHIPEVLKPHVQMAKTDEEDIETLCVDQQAYRLLRNNRMFAIIYEEQQAYVYHAQGNPVYVGFIETGFTLEQPPQFDLSMMRTAWKALSAAKFMMKNYEGLLFNEESWVYDFDMHSTHRSIFESIPEQISEIEQELIRERKKRIEKSGFRLVR